MAFVTQVLVVGPKGSGKTTLTKLMSEWEVLAEEYVPTTSVRIEELEREHRKSGQHMTVQLWDCAGDEKFEDGWPALAHGARGILLVYDPDMADAETRLEDTFRIFGQPNNLRENQCRVVAVNHNPRPTDSPGFRVIPLGLHHAKAFGLFGYLPWPSCAW